VDFIDISRMRLWIVRKSCQPSAVSHQEKSASAFVEAGTDLHVRSAELFPDEGGSCSKKCCKNQVENKVLGAEIEIMYLKDLLDSKDEDKRQPEDLLHRNLPSFSIGQ
jgi:hypothetical protein